MYFTPVAKDLIKHTCTNYFIFFQTSTTTPAPTEEPQESGPSGPEKPSGPGFLTIEDFETTTTRKPFVPSRPASPDRHFTPYRFKPITSSTPSSEPPAPRRFSPRSKFSPTAPTAPESSTNELDKRNFRDRYNRFRRPSYTPQRLVVTVRTLFQ